MRKCIENRSIVDLDSSLLLPHRYLYLNYARYYRTCTHTHTGTRSGCEHANLKRWRKENSKWIRRLTGESLGYNEVLSKVFITGNTGYKYDLIEFSFPRENLRVKRENTTHYWPLHRCRQLERCCNPREHPPLLPWRWIIIPLCTYTREY